MDEIDKLTELLEKSQIQYYEGDPELDDEEYDALEKFLIEEKGVDINKRPTLGDVELHYPMPSISKIKNKELKKLTTFIKDYPPPYLISTKEDGTSLQLIYRRGTLSEILTGGSHGITGKDVTHLKNYIDFPTLKEELDMVIRGELTIKQKDFESFVPRLKEEGKKAKISRSIVNGIVNSKTIDEEIAAKCVFIAFEILSEEDNILDQLEFLDNNGFILADPTLLGEVVDSEDFNNILNEELTLRLKESEYRLDGLVCVAINSYKKTNENKEPDYAFAFKRDSTAISTVLDIEWRLTSRYGRLTPVAIIEPVEILGHEITGPTCHNAKFLKTHGIGIGSVVVVRLSHDSIPSIESCLLSKDFPFPNIPYHEDENEVQFIADNYEDCPEVKMAEISNFIKCLGIKECGDKFVEKLYNAGFQTIESLIYIKQSDISKLERMGEKSSFNIMEELKKGLSKVTFPKLMAATNIFGYGCGETVMEKFIRGIPHWEISDVTEEEIMNLPDFGPVRSKQIAENLPIFKEWLDNNPKCYPKKVEKRGDLEGCIICFTGGKNQSLIKSFESRGAKVKDSLTKDVNILITDNMNSTSSKMVEAKKRQTRGIEIEIINIRDISI